MNMTGEQGNKPVSAEQGEGGVRKVAPLAVAQLVSWGSVYYGFSLFVIPMEHELRWSLTAINGAMSLGLLVSGACAYPVGFWIDRRGGRAVMTLGSVLASLMLAAWASVHALPALFLVWIGLGVAMSATLYDPAFAVITRRFPVSHRSKIIALTLVAGFASTVFIPLTQLFVERLGWRHALLALALLNVLICVPIHAVTLRDGTRRPKAEDKSDPGDAENKAAVGRALRRPSFWALTVCFTAYYANFAAMTVHLVPLLVERGVSARVIVAAMALIGPAQVIARVLLLLPGKALDTARTGRIATLVFTVSILLLIFRPASPVSLFLAVALYGGANGMLTIVRGTAVSDFLGPEGYGAINGLIALPSNAARAAGPIGAALIWSATGDYSGVLWAVLIVALVTAGSFWAAAALERPGEP